MTPIAERVQRPYHQAHYDKKQRTASAVAALFMQLVEADEIVMEWGKLQWEDSLRGMAKGSKTICQRLFRDKNNTVESAVVNLLDKPVPLCLGPIRRRAGRGSGVPGHSPEPEPETLLTQASVFKAQEAAPIQDHMGRRGSWHSGPRGLRKHGKRSSGRGARRRFKLA